MDEQQPPKTPPYVSYKTFRNYLDSLTQLNGNFTRIDKTAMRSLSGYNQIAVMNALRYLDLINRDGIPTARLRTLLAASTLEERQLAWRGILEDAYPFLLRADDGFELAKSTPGHFDEKFKPFGKGDTVRKGQAFFLDAAKEAGLVVSKMLLEGRKPGARSKPVSGRSTANRKKPVTVPQSQQQGTSGQALVPKDISSETPPANMMAPSGATQMDWRLEVAKMLQQMVSSIDAKVPPFQPDWQPEVQIKWLEVSDRMSERKVQYIDRLMTVVEQALGTQSSIDEEELES